MVILLSLILLFNMCAARLLTVPGAVFLNIGLFWLFLKLVVRALVFPGSIGLWKRNTEASYRVEMSKQFSHHLEHLRTFLLQATRPSSRQPNLTMDGVFVGYTVIEGMSRNFRIQQRDQVRFTAEQAQVRQLVQGIEGFLSEVKVRERSGTQAPPADRPPIQLSEWLQRMSQGIVAVPMRYALQSAELETGPEAGTSIERLEKLIGILDELQCPRDNCCANARRFVRTPTVGSLHQLRAELQARYSGRQQWVKTRGGRNIDGMMVSCLPGLDGQAAAHDNEELANDKVGLLDSKATAEDPNFFSGAFIVWCNPNAGYYETMVYESGWLDFYLSQGCSVFLFNYSGFGRSSGLPSPAALAEDGEAVVELLKQRGVTQIGVHGRSIGGIAACHLAAKFDLQILIADRTFSTLAKVAKLTFGNWAVQGLTLAATWADNASNFFASRCYKVLICDPKDQVIPDLASLRTAAALEALERVPQSCRLLMDDKRLRRVAEAWTFLEVLIGICDSEEDAAALREHGSAEAKRPARQPIIGNPADGEDMQMLVGSQGQRDARDGAEGPINVSWLEQHPHVVKTALAPHADVMRATCDVVGRHWNASGMTLEDTVARAYDDPCYALRCFLANLQVWGSFGSLPQPLRTASRNDLELFLSKGDSQHDSPEMGHQLARIAANLSPEQLSTYQRQLSRSLTALVRRDFRQRLAPVRRALEATTCGDDHVPRLCAAVLENLREIEEFVTAVHRFFKRVDLGEGEGLACDLEQGASGASDSSEEGVNADTFPELRTPRPTFDHTLAGNVVTVDCGHNGVLSEAETQHLALHLRAAQFGKYEVKKSANNV